jgi:flagellar basal-body rod protein FlgF
MGTTGYVTLSRQNGLLREMQVVANNIANASTTGYRQEGLVFSEFVKRTPDQSWLSMTRASARNTSPQQGSLTQTNGTFDLAIEGDGFFLLETPAGERLTRAGGFAPNAEGDLVTPGGFRVMDDGGSAVFVPPDASDIQIAADGTISVDGQPLGRIGVYLPVNSAGLVRQDGVMFRADDGVEPVAQPRMIQGFLEDSNVNPIIQVTRMIEIQRAYEMGQSFLESEDERIRQAVKALLR